MTELAFCAVPLPAMRDARLTGRHHRLLLCLAWHYRLGRNGRPCNARQATLARETNLDPADVSKLIDDLEAFGYVAVIRHPHSKKYRACALRYNTYSEFLGADTKTELVIDADLVPEPGDLGIRTVRLGAGTKIEPFQNPQISAPSQGVAASEGDRKRSCLSAKKKSCEAKRDLVETRHADEGERAELQRIAHQRIVEGLGEELFAKALDSFVPAGWEHIYRLEIDTPGAGIRCALDVLKGEETR
jgi:hypothetical protein